MHNGISFKSYWHTKYKRDVLLAFIIVVSPFLMYLHLFFGTGSSFSFFGHEYIHEYFDNEIFIWVVLKSAVPFLIFVIWYFTSSYKWKFFLFPFISLFLYYASASMRISEITINSITFNILILFILLFNVAIYQIDVRFFITRRKRRIRASIQNLFTNIYSVPTINNIRKDAEAILQEKESLGVTKYLNKLYSIKYVFKNQFKKRKYSLEDQQKVKTKWDNLYCLILFLSFVSYFTYYFIPSGIQEIDIGIMVIDAHGFSDVTVFIWFLSNKTVVLFPLGIWFLSCQSWWKYAILSPIVLYTYQLWEACQDVRYLDAIGNLRALPVILCVVLLLFIVSKTVKYQTGILDIYEYVIIEFEKLLQETARESNTSTKQQYIQYENLKQQIETSENTEEHLRALIHLKNKLIHELKSVN